MPSSESGEEKPSDICPLYLLDTKQDVFFSEMFDVLVPKVEEL